MSVTPSWPSLYNPGVELLHIPERDPVQPRGVYLNRPQDVFRFTLYWTLVFYIPIFLLCGTYAFWNLSFPPSYASRGNYSSYRHLRDTSLDNGEYPLSPLPQHETPSEHDTQEGSALDLGRNDSSQSHPLQSQPKKKPNPTRSRISFALLVFLTFVFTSIAGAVMSSAVVGFVLAGLYKAGGFYVST